MKKFFWNGLIITASALFIKLVFVKILIPLASHWNKLYDLLIPLAKNSLLKFFFGLICSLLAIVIIGAIVSFKIKGKRLIDYLLKYTAQIPGIKSIVKLVSQLAEAGESFSKKKNKLAIYKAPNGKRIIGIIKPKKINLIYNKTKIKEEVLPFFEPFPPYVFTGKLYLVKTKYLYLIKNIAFEGFIKFVATAGFIFGLPRKLILSKMEEHPLSNNSKSAN